MVKQAKTYNHDKLGDIELAPEVLEVISNIAANEVSGVYALKGTFSTDMKALFTNQTNYKKGVQLSYKQDGINLDVYCNLNLGVNVPKVALEIQERVKEQIYHMTDIELSEVNVHIVSMVSDKV